MPASEVVAHHLNEPFFGILECAGPESGRCVSRVFAEHCTRSGTTHPNKSAGWDRKSVTRSNMERGSRMNTGSVTFDRSIPIRNWEMRARRMFLGSSSSTLRERPRREKNTHVTRQYISLVSARRACSSSGGRAGMGTIQGIQENAGPTGAHSVSSRSMPSGPLSGVVPRIIEERPIIMAQRWWTRER